jgi:tetratricopeptide (TPR) repeat protein
MKNLHHHLWLACLIVSLPFYLGAQTQLLTTPRASQQAKVSQRIGLTDVTVAYHRPAANGRDIWGQLVPQGQVWRAGANENTIIKFSTDVKVEGRELAAGTYGLHMEVGEEQTSVIFSNNSTSWGSFSYNPAEDALRVTVKNGKAPHSYEYLTYEFIPKDAETGICALNWGDRQIAFSYAVDLENTVLVSLRNELRDRGGFSWQGYNEAANYCLQNNFNHQEAMAWATRSVFMQPTPQNLITKARLAGQMKAGAGGKPDTDVMMASLEKDLDAYPTTWKEWNAAAAFAQNNGDLDRAVKWGATSVRMSPQMTNMMAQSAYLAALGKDKEAKNMQEEAIERGSNAELNAYGYQLLFAGKGKEAIEIFKANTDKFPEDPNVWDSLGEGYTTIGEKDNAIKAFKKSLSLNPPPNVRANSLKLLKQLGVDDIHP